MLRSGTIATLASGLAKMPVFSGTVTRGADLAVADLAPYIPGKRVVESFFVSTTRADRDDTEFAGNTKFVITSKRGRDVSVLSQVPEKEEVLFPPADTAA